MKDLRDINETKLEDMSKQIYERFIKNEGFADLLGVNENTVQYIYGAAKYAYDSGKFEEALKVFSIILVFDRNNPIYLFGYASTLQALGLYPNAIEFFAEAGKRDPENPKIDIEIAKCFIAISNLEMAKKALEHASLRAKTKSARSKIDALQRIINKK